MKKIICLLIFAFCLASRPARAQEGKAVVEFFEMLFGHEHPDIKIEYHPIEDPYKPRENTYHEPNDPFYHTPLYHTPAYTPPPTPSHYTPILSSSYDPALTADFGRLMKKSEISDKLIALGFGDSKNKDALIVKFQHSHGLDGDDYDYARTEVLVNAMKEIDELVPADFKINNQKFKQYHTSFFKAVQKENGLAETGLLDKYTIDVLRAMSDKKKITDALNFKNIPNDFVHPVINHISPLQETWLDFHFNDKDFEYIAVNNKLLNNDGTLGYKMSRVDGSILPVTLPDMLDRYNACLNELAVARAGKYNIVNLGFISKDEQVTIQIGGTSLTVSEIDLENFINNQEPIKAMDDLLADGTAPKPLVIFNSAYNTGAKSINLNYNYLLSTDYSAVNPVKFAAALNQYYGKRIPVYMVSDLKGIDKIEAGAKFDTDPSFEIYSPNKTYYDYDGNIPKDFGIVNNLQAKGLKREYFHRLPKRAVKPTETDWTARRGGKLFISHKNDDFTMFLLMVNPGDNSPYFLVSCYLPKDEYVMSTMIRLQKLSHIIYFSEKISPTAATDVLMEYYRLSKLPENSSKSFYQLWSESILAAKAKYNQRYTPKMLKEVDKLYKVVQMYSFEFNTRPMGINTDC